MLGQRVAAVVVSAPGAAIDAEMLQDYLSGRLFGFMVPEKIVLTDHLPLGPTGKVSRSGLAALYGAEIEDGDRDALHADAVDQQDCGAPGNSTEGQISKVALPTA